MSELTDLEICKRIAEIEGKKGHEFMGVFVLGENYNEAVNESHSNSYSFSPCHYEYSPLTDDAICFQLMVKYDCDLISPYRPNNDTHWECQIFTDNCTDAVSIYNDSPNKAICLAIIEAHKVKS